jgi:hypothetical protein
VLLSWSRYSPPFMKNEVSLTLPVLPFFEEHTVARTLFWLWWKTLQPPIQWVTWALSLGIKRPMCEADHSPPSNAWVKECVKLYFHSPNTPSWRRAQLKEYLASCTVGTVVQLYGAPPHFSHRVRAFMDREFPNSWKREGPIPWPPRSPDLSTLNYCGFKKKKK